MTGEYRATPGTKRGGCGDNRRPGKSGGRHGDLLCETRSPASWRAMILQHCCVFGVWLRVSARLASTTRCAHYTAIRLNPNRPTPCLVTRPALVGARRGPAPRWQSPRRREPRLAGCPSRGWARSRGSPEPVCDWEPGVGGSAGSLRRWVVDARRWVGRASVPASMIRHRDAVTLVEQRRGRRRVRADFVS